jgi:hypothetical protein
VAGADTTAEAVNGLFEDTADGIVVLSLMFKLSAAAGSTATPVHQCKPAAGADTTAEAANGVLEDTADRSVVWSSISKLMEISKAFLDLLRSAAKKDPELQATREKEREESRIRTIS